MKKDRGSCFTRALPGGLHRTVRPRGKREEGEEPSSEHTGGRAGDLSRVRHAHEHRLRNLSCPRVKNMDIAWWWAEFVI
ncbi:hypothetical protein CRG98_022207 [Punica granatum]|uniref:Uncharacterized protein n=1 Tax=Punica granatum TaxID=22663 RepID=A0A2I0JM45_PUNGR|nr:hypothetical protein CRG98_022207 [Punica granatum]